MSHEDYKLAEGSQQLQPTPEPTQSYAAPPEPVAPPVNPLLQKLHIPAEIHRIPSGGQLYDPGVLSGEGGEVHVYPMTAIDELEIKSPDLLFSGEALINVIRRCVPDVLNPEELFIRDVDFLMLVIRKATFGSTYEIPHTHTCEDAKEHTYGVELGNIISAAKSINPIDFKRISQLTIGSDDVKYNVTLSPMRLKHMIKLMQVVDTANTQSERSEKLFSAMVMLIRDIDGITDEKSIFDLLSAIPTTWAEEIATRADELGQWGANFTTPTKCKDCGSEVELHVNINPLSFFTLQ